jgi:superfamily I DNA/RNA helicase
VTLLPLLAVIVQTLSGAPVDALAAPPGVRAIVYIFTSPDCPVSNRYAPEIRRIAERFTARGVAFRLVYPARGSTDDAIRDHMAAFSYAGALDAVRDPDFALAKFSGATITPEAVVVVDGAVAYRGRIDDRVVNLGLERPAATVHDLSDALSAVLAGRRVPHSVTQAVGCYIADLAR